MTKWTRGLAVLALGLIVPACANDATAPAANDVSFAPMFTTTTSSPVVKTAVPYWSQRTTYDWTIEKTVTPANLVLGTGQSGSFNYTINVDRSAGVVVNEYGMTGQMCVTNTAASAGEITSLVDEFYSYDGGVLTLVATLVVDYSSNAVLDPGETGCYPYTLVLEPGFTPDPALTYKNRVKVTGVAVGTTSPVATTYSDFVPVVFPAAPTATEIIDESASVVDVLPCPMGFTCTPAGGMWNFGESASQPLNVLVTNVNAPCGQMFTFVNTATLTEDDSGDQSSDDATSTVNTPGCDNWDDETATSAGVRYPNTRNWFMYMKYTTAKVDLIAGQHYDAGDIYMQRVSGGTRITIVLASGWRFGPYEENLKIQPFASAPTYLPSIGSFQYKYDIATDQTTIVVTVPSQANYFGIHGDMQRLITP